MARYPKTGPGCTEFQSQLAVMVLPAVTVADAFAAMLFPLQMIDAPESKGVAGPFW